MTAECTVQQPEYRILFVFSVELCRRFGTFAVRNDDVDVFVAAGKAAFKINMQQCHGFSPPSPVSAAACLFLCRYP